MHQRISFAVQHHPSRADLIGPLLETIGADVEVVTDPDPRHPFPSPWRTYQHALERTPIRATHRLILQDDVRVCRDFAVTAARAIQARPDRLIAFFVSGRLQEHIRAVTAACDADVPWCELGYLSWCPAVALAWPIRLVPAILNFVDKQQWPPEFRADDEIVGRFLRFAKEHPLASVPSLVEHPDLSPSLVSKRAAYGQDPGRIAACFIHPDCDPGLIDWASGPGA